MYLRAGLMFGNRGSRTKQRNNAKLKKEKRDSQKQKGGKENQNGMRKGFVKYLYAGRMFEENLTGKKEKRKA